MPRVTAGARRRSAPVAACAASAVLALAVLLGSAEDAAGAPQHATQPLARAQPTVASGPPITAILRTLATNRTIIVFRARYRHWSNKRVVRAAKAVVKTWALKKATECPDPLPDWFFCEEPPRSSWGRGMARAIDGRWAGAYYSQWRPSNPPQSLRPGFVFWLTCWSFGAEIDNGPFRSSIWYRLTNGLWVSATWLYAVPNEPNVAPC